MSRGRFAAAAMIVGAAGCIGVGAAAGSAGGAAPRWLPPVELGRAPLDRHPEAVRAEEHFFRALNHDRTLRDGAIELLTSAFVSDPSDGGTNLCLGLAHLWIVAESGGPTAGLLDRALLARHFLERAARLRPEDTRIPSWLAAIGMFIARVEQDEAAGRAAEAQLLNAFRDDPTFHAVSVGIVRWDNPPGSPAFAEGLEAMRLALDGAPDDPSAMNQPRWPYNVEGFTLAMADYELKAGNRQRAAVMLNSASERPGYESWPYRHLVEARLEDLHGLARLFADGDPANDPPFVLGGASGVSCVVCHQGAAAAAR